MTEHSLLHVVVGHGLPVYFLNAVRSVIRADPDSPILVIDNASPDYGIRRALLNLAEEHDGRLSIVFRDDNDIEQNGKVGSLYAAYELAFSYASELAVEFVHLVQADMQMIWWDEDMVAFAAALLDRHPMAANVKTIAFSRDKRLSEDLLPSATPGVFKLAEYGLTDTGLYSMPRWRGFGMSFGGNETERGMRYLKRGHEVLCHPWPTVAQIPWPAVVRRGVQRGKEVVPVKPFLLRNLELDQVAAIKNKVAPVWLEDVCVPWGWTCLTPMWVTDTEAAEYWVMRFREMRQAGIRKAVPRIETRGVDRTPLAIARALRRHRPPLWRLSLGLVALARELFARRTQSVWRERTPHDRPEPVVCAQASAERTKPEVPDQ